jgi:hypothetical protein
MGDIAEFHVEEITLDLFGSLGYGILLGSEGDLVCVFQKKPTGLHGENEKNG